MEPLIAGIADLIGTIAGLYVFVLLGRVICSWVNADPYNPIVRFLYVATDPVLDFIRRFIPPIAGLDLSPLIAILAVQILVQRVLVEYLYRLARALG